MNKLTIDNFASGIRYGFITAKQLFIFGSIDTVFPVSRDYMENISLSAAVLIPSPKARDYIEMAREFPKSFYRLLGSPGLSIAGSSVNSQIK